MINGKTKIYFLYRHPTFLYVYLCCTEPTHPAHLSEGRKRESETETVQEGMQIMAYTDTPQTQKANRRYINRSMKAALLTR